MTTKKQAEEVLKNYRNFIRTNGWNADLLEDETFNRFIATLPAPSSATVNGDEVDSEMEDARRFLTAYNEWKYEHGIINEIVEETEWLNSFLTDLNPKSK